MTKLFIFIAISTACFFILDALWFKIAGGFFRSEIHSLITFAADGSWQVRITPAVIAYVLMGIGAAVFVLPLSTSFSTAALYGAVFGLVSFGIYDMTNLALLSGWTLRFAVVDMLWGTFSNMLVATFLFWVRNTWLS